MTVNLHLNEGEWINLGMIRVWFSQTAETLLKLVELRLEEYGLSIEGDIVAMVTDMLVFLKFFFARLSAD